LYDSGKVIKGLTQLLQRVVKVFLAVVLQVRSEELSLERVNQLVQCCSYRKELVFFGRNQDDCVIVEHMCEDGYDIFDADRVQ
jgi:hypothetical protein